MSKELKVKKEKTSLKYFFIVKIDVIKKIIVNDIRTALDWIKNKVNNDIAKINITKSFQKKSEYWKI